MKHRVIISGPRVHDVGYRPFFTPICSTSWVYTFFCDEYYMGWSTTGSCYSG